MKNMETEFKWDANVPRAFVRMLRAVNTSGGKISPCQNLKIKDVYLDHNDRSFEAQKIALRVRSTDGSFEATFKTRTETRNGKAVRREETLPLEKIKNLQQALKFLNRKKSWKGLAVDGLSPRFEIRNRRQSRRVLWDGAEFELSFDTCEILVCGRTLKMKEIELELKRGSVEKLDALCALLSRESGLKPMRCSKVKTACALLGLWGNK